MSDPICVYLEDAGPIPPLSAGGLRWSYVAYRDAERDHGIYGYGHTQADAIADFCRNEAEAHCAACTRDCDTSSDCILTSGNLAAYIKIQQVIHMNQQIGPEGIAKWKALKRSIQSKLAGEE